LSSRAEKLIIVLYIALGVVLALSGFSILWMANSGIISSEFYIRLAIFGLGIFLLLLGVHLVIAGVNSLRG